jgi:pimeloyl-ACP methyl ester carboxylesterase
MDFVTAPDGMPIAVHTVGSAGGAPAVVIPGGPCRGVEYLGDLAGLGSVRRLKVIHPRGTLPTGGLSRGWWNDAGDVIAVADSLGLEAVDLIAHSAGTRLALAVAARFPGRVRSLTLVTPAAAWLTGTPHDGVAVAARRVEPMIDSALASMGGPAPTNEAAFQLALGVEGPAGYANWSENEREHSNAGAMTLAAATAWFNDIPRDAPQRIVGASLPPSLVIGGREDILSGVHTVQAYAEALGAELVLIDDCGHYPWVEQPIAFREAATDWLTPVPQTR